MTRSPLDRDSARCSAWSRHTLTLKNEVSPSRHSPSCWMRWVTATRRLVTGVPVLVNRNSGVSTRLPAMVVWLSAAIRCSLLDAVRGGLAFGAHPFWTTAAPDQLAAGGAGGVGGSVVLAGQPHDRVGIVLAGDRDGDPGAEGEGGFAVAHALVAVGAVGVGGDAEGGVELVEGLLAGPLGWPVVVVVVVVDPVVGVHLEGLGGHLVLG